MYVLSFFIVKYVDNSIYSAKSKEVFVHIKCNQTLYKTNFFYYLYCRWFYIFEILVWNPFVYCKVYIIWRYSLQVPLYLEMPTIYGFFFFCKFVIVKFSIGFIFRSMHILILDFFFRDNLCAPIRLKVFDSLFSIVLPIFV